MVEAKKWWAEWEGARRPWLLLDGGPSLARRGEFDLAPYAVLALGKAALEMEADVVSFADIQMLRQAGPERVRRAQFLLMPAQPRDGQSAGRPLEEYFADLPILKELADAGRLVRYDTALVSGSPSGRTEAAEALWLLGALGARHVRTLGVDHGADPTPEAVRSADGVAAAIQKFSLYSGPLTAEAPARLYIGSDPSQALGAKILEYSVRKHSTISTEFDTMQHVRAPMPKDPLNQPRTEFSFNRFAIPKLAGYHGRALYVDADMLVFSDLRELWEMPFDGATVMYVPPSNPKRPKQTSVMLLDCDRLSWDLEKIVQDLDEKRYNYGGLMTDIALEPAEDVRPSLPIVWNSLEEYTPNQTRLLHYTDMKTQPWVSRRNPLDHLWTEVLIQALADGFVTVAEVKEAVRDGYVRPSLLWQLRVKPERWDMFRRAVAPVLDVRHKPHRGLRKRLSKAKLGVS